ncbi:malonyl-CoA decarboxylase [Methylocapsa polymorpha]|uniref:Malonyl-CoA decarboxylase n=1 Tax=Methylocapsa polymorpha TaxID=3080828 RepID=A0ABZ0HX95_9HYPH|nr:malonyl-CoA decarboxylase [Methylocapsa sp. RX1]
MNSAAFFDVLASITDRSRNLLSRRDLDLAQTEAASGLIDLCEALLSGRGEASGTAIATEVLERYLHLDATGRLALFEGFAEKFGPDRAKLADAAESWLRDPFSADASDLHYFSEARRQELFRRLNRAPGGTHALVRMRADLLELAPNHKALAPVDRDLVHLLSSWFNRGFLMLRRIDWSSPAIVLEKIIHYEAVHEIRDWADLRRRIDPLDRRCYGFFHPALIDEPLIFVEVALTEAMPSAIAPLLAEDRPAVALEQARTAVFYSISNCQRGLAGISFGNFLIKQVAEDLRRELPKLDTFVTLSPAPGFLQWLQRDEGPALSPENRSLLESLDDSAWPRDALAAERLRRVMEPLAAQYFLKAKRADGKPLDPVARFHLGNGAKLERINWRGDLSAKGLRDSAGLMVNYLYDLDEVEKNHEAYANQGEVVASAAVKKLLKSETRSRFGRAAAASIT